MRLVIERLRRTYDAFGFVFDDVMPFDRSGWTYLFMAEVTRSALGLNARLQPGDIDVLIVPSYRGIVRPEFIAAIEVKRLPLRTGMLGKNVGRFGATQAMGLIRDGFPLVGILHIVINEPGTENYVREVEMWEITDETTQRMEFRQKVTMNLTGSEAADMQIARLRGRAINENIGLNAIALQRSCPGGTGFYPFPSYGRRAKLNPRADGALMARIVEMAERVGPSAPQRD